MGRRALMSTSSAPYSSPRNSPSPWRILRARAGEAPPVEMATVRSPWVKRAGTMKLHFSGWSTMLQRMPRAAHSRLMAQLLSSSLVAAMTRKRPSRSAGVNSRRSMTTPGTAESAAATSVGGAGSRTRTSSGPQAASVAILRRPTCPAPTTRQRLP